MTSIIPKFKLSLLKKYKSKLFDNYKKLSTISHINKSLNLFETNNYEFQTYNGSKSLDKNSALEKILSGSILVIKDYLFRSNFINDIEKILSFKFSEIPNVHNQINILDIMSLIINKRKNLDTLTLQSKIIGEVCTNLNLDNVFVELEPNIRLHPPYDFSRRFTNQIESKIGTGQMTTHAVHKDSWYFHPKNTINIWIALTKTSDFSGMSVLENSQNFYPKFNNFVLDDYKNAFSHLHTNVSLNPGDLIIFLSELMHGSIINQTKDTRGALSMRFTLSEPNNHISKAYWYQKFSLANNLKWQISSKSKNNHAFNPKLEHSQNDFYRTTVNNYPLELENNKIKVFDKKNFYFPSKCPHQGVDLINGYYCPKNKSLICPAHKLQVSSL